jgi:hypothetical protein
VQLVFTIRCAKPTTIILSGWSWLCGRSSTTDQEAWDPVYRFSGADKIVLAKTTPGGDIGCGRRIVGNDGDYAPDADGFDSPSQLDDRQRAAHPATIEH